MISIKQYDTARLIAQTLTIGSAPIDLTGADVTLAMKRISHGTVSVVEATIVDAEGGEVSYQPLDSDVANAGDFELEWRIVFPGNNRLTVPTNGRTVLRIHPAL